MERAFEKVYGVKEAFQGVSLMGRTDPSILQEVLNLKSLEWREPEVEKFREFYYWYLDEELQKSRKGKALCPGILPLLSMLQKGRDIETGLLTGNWRYSGYMKLRHFGIDGFFQIGAFADDSRFRKDLVPIAMDRYFNINGIRLSKEAVYVIGDTPLDILGAKPHGVRTVAVATGMHTVDDLLAENPDFLFENFLDKEKVAQVFLEK